MEGNRAALRYAKAALSLAQDNNVAAEVNADMKRISETISASEDLQVALSSPRIKESIMKNILAEVFPGVNGVTSGIFQVLIENKRISILSLVASRYNLLYDALNKVQVAKVTTAVPLTPQLEDRIQAKVKELTGNEAKIQNIIDESILGGFILRVGDLQYNASIAAQLNMLKREFNNDAYISKL